MPNPGVNGVQCLSEKPSSNLAHLEDLSPLRSHPQKWTKRVPKKRRDPKRWCPLHFRNTNPRQEKMLRHKRPLPYSTPKTKNPRENISQDQERSKMLQELLLFLPRSVVITNEEMSSLYSF